MCGNRHWNVELMWVSVGPVPYYERNKASNASFENKHINKPLHVIRSTTNESYLLILDLYKKRGQTHDHVTCSETILIDTNCSNRPAWRLAELCVRTKYVPCVQCSVFGETWQQRAHLAASLTWCLEAIASNFAVVIEGRFFVFISLHRWQFRMSYER